MKITEKITITDNTSKDDVDIFLTCLFDKKQQTNLEIDTSRCRKISVRKILGFKDVLDKHRDDSLRYIDESIIIVKNGFVSKIVKTALFFLKPEVPIKVERS